MITKSYNISPFVCNKNGNEGQKNDFDKDIDHFIFGQNNKSISKNSRFLNYFKDNNFVLDKGEIDKININCNLSNNFYNNRVLNYFPDKINSTEISDNHNNITKLNRNNNANDSRFLYNKNQFNNNNFKYVEQKIPQVLLNSSIENKNFYNYIKSLNIPLLKFLCTKKGLIEMNNYLSIHGNINLEIILYSLGKDGITKLMKHKLGNYFIQEIIKCSNYPQLKLILEFISDDFVDISESHSGTHVIQILLAKIYTYMNSPELRHIILKSIESKELEMALNNNATYVLQKIITTIPDHERYCLNKIILNNFVHLSINPECVFLIEKFITTTTIVENKKLINEIICANCIQLANNPYGNYLIQFLLKLWKGDDISKINDIIINNSSYLIKEKYASNVIEKAIEVFDNQNLKRLIQNLYLGDDVFEIIKSQYGHYVLNKTIKFMDEEVKNEVEKILNSKMENMNKKEKIKAKKFIGDLNQNNKHRRNFFPEI